MAHMVEAYKAHGHLIAQVEPLGIARDDPLRAPFLLQDVPVLQLEFHGLRNDAEMQEKLFWIGDSLAPVLPGPREKMRVILSTLRKVYCGNIGAQFTHVIKPDCKAWLDRRVLQHALHEPSDEEKRGILHDIRKATLFEEFCGLRLSGAKRFSLEGCEALIPGLEALLRRSCELGITAVEMGMTHRGRLNVLRNVLDIPMEALLYRFQEYLPDDNEHPNNSDDVRYHLGTSVVKSYGDLGSLRLSLAANPSHLEAINSVVLGKTRARQFLLRGDTLEDDSGANMVSESPKQGSVDYSPSDDAKKQVMGLLLHGDASFYQGSVREVLGFSNLRDYTTGGTVHIIINNQIGFTTLPKESHSSIYCSDVALSIGAPVFHVSGDNPEAVAQVCRTAVEYRQEFGRDCIVNIWGYRRHGHNELDDPGITQPIMYSCISKKPCLLEAYGDHLVDNGVVSDPAALRSADDEILADYSSSLEQVNDHSKRPVFMSMWNELGILGSPKASSGLTQKQLLNTTATGVDVELLRSYGRAMFMLPPRTQLNAHAKVRALFAQRLRSIEFGAGHSIKWATAEALAFGSLLEDGFHIRLSGQDVERGTFNQRHAVVYDQVSSDRGNEALYKPWTALQKLEWHQQDIRRNLVERANSLRRPSGDGTGCNVPDEEERASAHSRDDEEESYAAGLYHFPSEQEQQRGASKSGRKRSKTLSPAELEIESLLERISEGVESRAQQLRDARRVLRWREPRNPRNATPELGVMEVCNSPLSEEAVLGFEHGYSLYSPNILPIWEAQFGDFANCAQTIIDTFIASGEEKWVRSSGVVLLLPHGYDGQGPDHSSARLERFLQLCAEDDQPVMRDTGRVDEMNALLTANMHVLNLSTPSQYFHALRRHMILPVRKPLVIMTPKYLLHHKPCQSSLDEFGPSSSFQTVMQDPCFAEHGSVARMSRAYSALPSGTGAQGAHVDEIKNVKRVIICSGKMYYHLLQKRRALGMHKTIAIVRIEQLCPFPFHSVRQELSNYLCNNDVDRAVELMWVQEEPKNMGAWTFVEPRLQWVLQNMPLSDANATRLLESPRRSVTYCGRPVAAAAATGSFELHREEMNAVLQEALLIHNRAP